MFNSDSGSHETFLLSVRRFSCACAYGFHGTFCEVNVDDCQDHGCENGATCVDGVGNYTCLCPPNYTGMKPASQPSNMGHMRYIGS